MKYIKNFNEDNKDEYYIKVSSGEIADYKCMIPSIQFVDYMNRLFPDKTPKKPKWSLSNKQKYDEFGRSEDDIGYTCEEWNYGVSVFKFCTLNYTKSITKRLIFSISELPDEYFYAFDTINHKHYKCDQLDGVKELLVDKGIII